MKTLREYIDILDEISRRDFLKGAGAAAAGAALGMPKDAAADRQWSTDPISGNWIAELQSETYPGARMTWNEDTTNWHMGLLNPTNWSPYNVEKERLYFPKITSPEFVVRLGNNQPLKGKGVVYTFPLRQLGNYKGYGLTLSQDKKTMDRLRNDFINADKIAIRIQIDGAPTTIVFNENPELLRQRQQQQQQQQQKQQQKQQQSSDAELDQLRADFKASLQRFDQEREKYRKESQSLEESEPDDPIRRIERLFRDA